MLVYAPQLDLKKAARLDSESKALSDDMVDEEEFAIIKRERAAKKNYRALKDEYESLKVSSL